ncbi:hypothetical protein Tco_0990847 [Tanacetum coccineum]|uniref:Uncharacterized protein n=1 Tax=Tanacetum coccineum TaxID=301880 RepID=A0ABQ5EYD1_9ASTR
MKELKKCIFNGPYVMTRVLVLAKPTTKIDPPIPEHTVQETYENTLPENRAYIDVEAEAIHMIFSGSRMKFIPQLMHAKQLKKCGQPLNDCSNVSHLTSRMSRPIFSGNLASLLQEMGSQLNHTTQGSTK